MPDDAAGPIEYFVPFTDRDRMRVRYFHRRGVPTDVMVNLECQIGGRWVSVRRYDSHVHYHVHMYPWDESRDHRLAVPPGPGGLAGALTEAIRDIKANWEQYRAEAEAELGGGEP